MQTTDTICIFAGKSSCGVFPETADMLRLSKRIEYGLLAVQLIAVRNGSITTAKEIAEQHNISFELLAKVLHVLSKSGFLISHQGSQGGYTLAMPAEILTVADIIAVVEGRQNIVDCAYGVTDCNCAAFHTCTIKSPMQLLQERIDDVFRSMTVAELAGATVATS